MATTPPATTPPATIPDGFRPRRRDRHGRGLRGPLAPSAMPLSLTRSQQFDELVGNAVDRLERSWAQELNAIDVTVEDVPDPGRHPEPAPSTPLGRSDEADGDRPARIVVYRRAVEARARGERARELLVHEVVVEALAELLGLDPATVDPDSDSDSDI